MEVERAVSWLSDSLLHAGPAAAPAPPLVPSRPHRCAADGRHGRPRMAVLRRSSHPVPPASCGLQQGVVGLALTNVHGCESAPGGGAPRWHRSRTSQRAEPAQRAGAGPNAHGDARPRSPVPWQAGCAVGEGVKAGAASEAAGVRQPARRPAGAVDSVRRAEAGRCRGAVASRPLSPAHCGGGRAREACGPTRADGRAACASCSPPPRAMTPAQDLHSTSDDSDSGQPLVHPSTLLTVPLRMLMASNSTILTEANGAPGTTFLRGSWSTLHVAHGDAAAAAAAAAHTVAASAGGEDAVGGHVAAAPATPRALLAHHLSALSAGSVATFVLTDSDSDIEDAAAMSMHGQRGDA